MRGSGPLRPALPRNFRRYRLILSSRSPFVGSAELPGSYAPTLCTMERSDPSKLRQSMSFLARNINVGNIARSRSFPTMPF